jgi:CheY-like chemotaxis protein
MMPAIDPPTAASVRDPLQILVADDNELIRAAVRGLLQRLGHSVDVATDGREAVEVASRRRFDIVFLDMQMPGMDGIEAALSIRASHPADPPRIVGISAESEGWASDAAILDDFLLKPVSLSDLVRVTERGPGYDSALLGLTARV